MTAPTIHDANAGHIATYNEGLALVETEFVTLVSADDLVAPGALDAALAAGRPGQAALDVFDTEPLPHDAAVLRQENVLATPHLGYVERASYELYLGVAFRNLVDYANGTPKRGRSACPSATRAFASAIMLARSRSEMNRAGSA